MSYLLKMPDERGAQLKMIAEREGKTAVDVVTDMIRTKLAEYGISADLPGVTVEKTDKTVRIEMPNFEGEVSAIEAATLADSLRDASAAANAEGKRRWLEGLGALSGIKVERMAQGVRLVSPITGQTYPLTFSVAADLADQIDRTVE